MNPYNTHTIEGTLSTEDAKLVLLSKAYEEIDSLEKTLTALRIRHGEAIRTISEFKTAELNKLQKHMETEA